MRHLLCRSKCDLCGSDNDEDDEAEDDEGEDDNASEKGNEETSEEKPLKRKRTFRRIHLRGVLRVHKFSDHIFPHKPDTTQHSLKSLLRRRGVAVVRSGRWRLCEGRARTER